MHLAAAEYGLAQLARGIDVEPLTPHLVDFARMRALSAGPVESLLLPNGYKERQRLDALDRLRGAEQVEAWKKVTKEYHDWWDRHVGQPIHVPSPPPAQ